MSTPVDDIRSEVWREIDETAEQRRRADCFDTLLAALEELYGELEDRDTAPAMRAKAAIALARKEGE